MFKITSQTNFDQIETRATMLAAFNSKRNCAVVVFGDQFIQLVRSELLVMFTANNPTYGQLIVDFGALCQRKSAKAIHNDRSHLKDPELRTEFQLRWFKQLARSG
jgi:hypothetical protein